MRPTRRGPVTEESGFLCFMKEVMLYGGENCAMEKRRSPRSRGDKVIENLRKGKENGKDM